MNARGNHKFSCTFSLNFVQLIMFKYKWIKLQSHSIKSVIFIMPIKFSK